MGTRDEVPTARLKKLFYVFLVFFANSTFFLYEYIKYPHLPHLSPLDDYTTVINTKWG